jgi:hypothetical protein
MFSSKNALKIEVQKKGADLSLNITLLKIK